MRKEINIVLRLTLISQMFTACVPVTDSKKEQDKSSIVESLEETASLTKNPETIIPILTATPSLTEMPIPTPTPEISYIRGDIDFGNPGKIALSITDPFKYYSFGNVVVYPDEFKDENGKTPDLSTVEGIKRLKELQEKWLAKNFHPGAGTMVSEMDNLGNIILFIHDGYIKKDNKQLEAEAIRAYIEGFTGKTIDDPDHIKITMESFVGTKINITQGSESSDFEVQAIVQVPHDQVSFYDSNAEALFENVNVISQNANKTNGATEAIEEYVKNGGGTAISICGWGIVGEDLMTTYTRYVIFLKPVQK